jgi:SAM-dependent methyltransferase
MITANIEDVRKFWDSRPCNIRHSQKPVGTIEYFDEVEQKKFTAEPHVPGFCEFDRWRGKRVLEIGCGIGTMAVNFARAGADYTGVELSQESLKITQQRFDVYGLQGKFYLADAEQLSRVVPIESYDLVFSFGVIHHSPNPRRIIDQCRLYLGDDSTLKIMVYAANSWKNYMIQAGYDQPEAQYGCPIAYTYTPQQLLDMVGRDFSVDQLVQDHIFPYQIEPYKQGQYIKQPWFEHMPPEIFRVLEQKLGWHLMLTATYRGKK